VPETLSDDRLLLVCDAAVAFLNARWTDKGPLDGVERDWNPTINLGEEYTPRHEGRRLYVIPDELDPVTVEIADRDDQQRKYRFFVLMVERYVAADGDADSPSKAWVDERAKWFVRKVFNPFANQSTVLLDQVTPDEEDIAKIGVLVKRDYLAQHKTFWAWAEFPYTEHTDLNGEVEL